MGKLEYNGCTDVTVKWIHQPTFRESDDFLKFKIIRVDEWVDGVVELQVHDDAENRMTFHNPCKRQFMNTDSIFLELRMTPRDDDPSFHSRIFDACSLHTAKFTNHYV